MTWSLDLCVRWQQEHGGVPGVNPIEVAYEDVVPLQPARDSLYRVPLQPLPSTHHLLSWFDALGGRPGWAENSLYSVRALPAAGARTLPRSARFCKDKKHYVGLFLPACTECGCGSNRLSGHWDGDGLRETRAASRRSVRRVSLGGGRGGFVEVILPRLEETFTVRVAGEREALQVIEDALRGTRSLALAPEAEVTRALQFEADVPSELSDLENDLREWSRVTVESVSRSVPGPSLMDGDEHDILLVCDDLVALGGHDWRDSKHAKQHLTAMSTYPDFDGLKEVKVKRCDVEHRFLMPGARSGQILPFVERGSTLLLESGTPWCAETVALLEARGMRYGPRGLGVSISVCGLRYFESAMRRQGTPDEAAPTHVR